MSSRGQQGAAEQGGVRGAAWFWGLSLRTRLMIIGVTGVAVALALGGLVLYRVLVFTVDRTLDNEARTAASQVVAMVEGGRMPSPLPVSGAQVIQVVDAQGRVVAASATGDRLVPLLRPGELARALSGRAVLVPGSRVGLSGPLRVRALGAGPPQTRSSVIVGLQVGDVLTSRAALRTLLLVAIPLLVLVLAAIAWRVIGWTLGPVEALRLGAERISGRDRQERLPVPPAADEIRALAITLNGMLDRLAAARSRQQSFVADAAHELRSPLTSIQTQLEVAAHLGEGGSLPADLLVDVARLSRLVEDLLLLARADADRRGPAARDLVDVESLVSEVASSYGTARVPVVVVAEDDRGGQLLVSADGDELRRAVGNLVDNAVRHAHTRVRLEVASRDADVVLSVVDDGPGIPAGDRDRVFDRFARLDQARDRDAGGSGLGLAIVRELVARADGTVSLHPASLHPAQPDTVPEGLRAEIRLPAVGRPGEPVPAVPAIKRAAEALPPP
jgi:signal transduction histidine kinase